MSEEKTNWVLVHQKRKDRREEQWLTHLPDLCSIAILKHLEKDHYRIFLPNFGQCEFFVRADKLKVNHTDTTHMNGFKLILKTLDLYLFEGKLLEKEKA